MHTGRRRKHELGEGRREGKINADETETRCGRVMKNEKEVLKSVILSRLHLLEVSGPFPEVAQASRHV